MTDFGVKGDFEVTLRFQILQEPDPKDVAIGGPGLSVRVDLDGPTGDMASLSRSVLQNQGSRLVSYLWKRVPDNGPQERKQFPTKAKNGQLRLVRTGAVLAYYVAEESSGDFVFLHEHSFGDADLKRICIAGVTGGPKTSLDVRITDFRIRADSISGLPAAAAGTTPVPATPTDSTDATGWWITALLVIFAATIFLAVALGALFYLRQRRQPDEPPVRAPVRSKPSKAESATSNKAPTNATKARQEKPGAVASPIVFSCSDCGRMLKVKPELAGKKVKCLQCGKAVLVPARAR